MLLGVSAREDPSADDGVLCVEGDQDVRRARKPDDVIALGRRLQQPSQRVAAAVDNFARLLVNDRSVAVDLTNCFGRDVA